MCCSCNWSYHPHNNMWFNNGPVSSFCGITALLKLFLDCRKIAFPVPGLHITSSQSILKITTISPNPISNTLILPWNKMPVSYSWHQLAVFTLFLFFFLPVWLIVQHSFPNQTLRIWSANSSSPFRALLHLPFLSEMNSSGWIFLPLFTYWSFRCCFYLCLLPYTSPQPPLVGLCLLKTGSLWCINR